MSLPNDLLGLFTSEYDKLENLVNAMNFDDELPVNQIVEVYYQNHKCLFNDYGYEATTCSK